MGSGARDGPTPRIRAEAENFLSPSPGSRGPEACAPGPDSHVRRVRPRSEVPVLGRSSVVGRGSRSPVHGVRGPRPADCPAGRAGTRARERPTPRIPPSVGVEPEISPSTKSRVPRGARRGSERGVEAHLSGRSKGFGSRFLSERSGTACPPIDPARGGADPSRPAGPHPSSVPNIGSDRVVVGPLVEWIFSTLINNTPITVPAKVGETPHSETDR